MDLIFLKPVFKEKIWGGNKLREKFGLDVDKDNTGEAWVISAHRNGVSKVISPVQFRGMGLDKLYKEHRELFGNSSEDTFPLLVKILDASDNLSVQVHPDDSYAAEHEGLNERGKTECWYIISADEGSEIVYGHNAQSREQFREMIENGQWNTLLRRVPVKAGDFFYVPEGTVHAIGKGIVILETQQSSDTTYRLYDYDRKDSTGNKRELHIEDSIAVTKIPFKDPNQEKNTVTKGENRITKLLECSYFSVYEYDVSGDIRIPTQGNYHLFTVIKGEGEVVADGRTYHLSCADSFISPYGIEELYFSGNMKIISSTPGEF